MQCIITWTKPFLYIHIFTTRGNLTFAITQMPFAIAAMSLLDMSCACCAFAHSRGEQVLFAWWTCFLSYSGNCTVEKWRKHFYRNESKRTQMVDSASNINESFFFFFPPVIFERCSRNCRASSVLGFPPFLRLYKHSESVLSRSMAAASRLSRVQRVHVTAQSASVCTCPRRKR